MFQRFRNSETRKFEFIRCYDALSICRIVKELFRVVSKTHNMKYYVTNNFDNNGNFHGYDQKYNQNNIYKGDTNTYIRLKKNRFKVSSNRMSESKLDPFLVTFLLESFCRPSALQSLHMNNQCFSNPDSVVTEQAFQRN